MPMATTMKPSTSHSTPRLSEVAQHLVIPPGIETSVWPKVQRRLREGEVEFDPWQQGLASAALGCRADGQYAATVGGVVVSIPRQVGKTFTVGHLLIGLAAEFPGLRIIWTSHHARTTTNTFRSMQGMVSRKKMLPLLAPNGIRTANGEQEIRFRNGSIIMFGAREHGFGRGMDAIDVEVFDEAQILSMKALEDMVPATNQARHRHGGLVFFMGTPPRPQDDGEAFASMRAAAISGERDDMMYVEIAADPDADPDDRKQWARMNPSFPHRTPEGAMLRMRRLIPDEASWRREAMGVWDSDSSGPVDLAQWARLTDMESRRPSPVVFAVEVSPDRQWSGVYLAGRRADGGTHVQVVESQRGTAWLPGRVVELEAKWSPLAVAVRAGSPGMSMVPALEEAGIELTVVSQAEMGSACGMFVDGVSAGTIRHTAQPLLERSLGAVTQRRHGEAWVWAPKGALDVSPLQGVTSALFVLAQGIARPPKRRSGVVV